MQQEIKTGGLERFFIACFRPGRYEELLKARTARHVIYVCLIVLLQVLIETVIPFSAWDLSVGGLNHLITDRLPAFTIENGSMEIEQPIEVELMGVIRFKADSGVDSYSRDDLSADYQEEILCSKGNLLLKMNGRVMDIPVTELSSGRIDNKSLAEALPVLRIFLGIYLISTFFVKIGVYMLAAIFFAILCRAAIRTPDGKFVTLKGTLVIAIYAKTLFTLLGSVNICLGAPIAQTLVLIAGTFGTMLFIDRAEAAVLKLTGRK
ncbi:MAG: DUF1189 family protein [Eubacterium sp.]|nr:DUF1189 family protein [Eubacterium sp.]